MSLFARMVRGIGGMLIVYAAAVLYFDCEAFWPRLEIDGPIGVLFNHPASGVIVGLALVVASCMGVARTEYRDVSMMHAFHG